MACEVIDRAIQIHGGEGLSGDRFLAHAYAGARSLRLADGPDEVHKMVIAMRELGRFPAEADAPAGWTAPATAAAETASA